MSSINKILCHFLLLLPSVLPASRSFPVNSLFESGGQNIGASASAPVPLMNIQAWFLLGLTDWISWQFKGLSSVFYSTKVWKHQFFSTQPSLWSNSHIHTWLLEKSWLWLDGHLSAKWCLCFFNRLSMFVIAFLLRSKCLLNSWLQSPTTVTLEPKKIKSVTVSLVSPSICLEVMGPDAMIFVFECWVLGQLAHSPLSPPSRNSLIPLCFVPLVWYHLHIWGCWYFSQKS